MPHHAVDSGALSAWRCGSLGSRLGRIECANSLCHLQKMLADLVARNLAEMTHQLDFFATETIALLPCIAEDLPFEPCEVSKPHPYLGHILLLLFDITYLRLDLLDHSIPVVRKTQ